MRYLSFELPAVHLPCTQLPPEQLFGARFTLPERARNACERHSHLNPLTLTLPPREEGTRYGINLP